ncbi:DUF262 domain-containing protein [Thermoguttaceae bacterium LCP21S3_D4]|nr:DUF262 domain-containing protein [Lachnospiraceae bacterium]
MATTIHSFMDIFDTTFGENQEAVQLKKIVIPIIQRDYAQGRRNSDVTRVRDRFLEALYKAVTEKPITLDFVYGDIDDEGNMTPLDGQQRLTTLFLLHWYAAKKGNIPEANYAFLKRFSYETRYSARYFCIDLVDFNPEFRTAISKEIVNQAWFPLDWENDPTISSMLVMLDAIDDKFKDVTDLWDKLKEKCITFYFLPIKDMGLTDELYIKMNSRGKPLTLFEHFKAELEREMRSMDENLANRIMGKIDRDWTDLLWEYRSSGSSDDNIIDDEFLRYFKFICDVICYKQNQSPIGRSNDEFDLLQQYFSAKCPDAIKNIETMESFLDCWCNIPGYDSPTDFLKSFMANKHENDKILVESRYNLNIFEDCLHAYSDKTGRIRQFPLNRIVLLYAITTYLRNRDKVTEEDFRRRIRIVNNLIKNSEDEVSDRTDRNRMPAILAETDAVILTGNIDDSITNNFNVSQLSEEKEKIEYLKMHPDKADTMFELEDHYLLNGQISIIGIDDKKLAYTSRFESLFKCSLDRVDCAMMAIGNYSQIERNKSRYQYGSTSQFAWNELFHKSANSGFENTRNILLALLDTNEAFSNEVLKKISDDFLRECESNNLYPFRYYYIKYSEYRPGSYGKMHNNSATENPYLFLVMQTKTLLSPNSYYPYLKVASKEHLSKDDMGQRLIFGDEHIICTNNSYLRRKNDDESIVDTIRIAQNDDGIDTEDRIMVLKNYIKENF